MKYPKSELYTKMLMEEEINHNINIKNCPIEVANDIWNAAIEEVIKEIEQFDKGCSPRSDIVPEIRKLKK